MAIKTPIPFTIFSPKTLNNRSATEVRFSRWNNANAEKFVRHERAQKEIEDEIRRERRYESASKIADISDNTTTSASGNESFKSIGTPSSPSRPSIPGKASKYSKAPNPNPNPKLSHPAFRRISKVSKVPEVPADAASGVTIGENGVSYRVRNAPFEFQYSYTETPKVKPLALREPPFVPFGPSTMPRPWTGRAPIPPSKKKLPEFDSFRLPPPHKKGVKPVQRPGPFLAGSGPKYTMSREEILGEPLTEEEIKELVQGCIKSNRQLNMGRDGLTHNMLDNIHAHWKRRRVCKIKCKGVCTVDMDNVCQQLEEKTGGKIIYSRGGVIFLFRGRNYNYRTRPRFPLMLWKPVTPVYPRLVQRVPEGLTLEETNEMRKKGRKLPPIRKLGKNGVYKDLIEHVREAFDECELVRINCQGMNASDYKKIGAKLKDFVPCVLISFELEHILMWRGRDWKSSHIKQEDDCKETKDSDTEAETSVPSNYVDSLPVEGQEPLDLCAPVISINDVLGNEDFDVECSKDPFSFKISDQPSVGTHVDSAVISNVGSETGSDDVRCADDKSAGMPMDLPGMNTNGSDTMFSSIGSTDNHAVTDDMLQDVSAGSHHLTEPERLTATCTEGVIKLWKQAVEGGSAVILDDASLDANVVYEKAVALAKDAPPGPVFKQRPRKVRFLKSEKQESQDLEAEEVEKLPEKRGNEKRNSSNHRMKGFEGNYPDILPQGSLKVDELAKLLA